jgi:hypothetical protein
MTFQLQYMFADKKNQCNNVKYKLNLNNTKAANLQIYENLKIVPMSNTVVKWTNLVQATNFPYVTVSNNR